MGDDGSSEFNEVFASLKNHKKDSNNLNDVSKLLSTIDKEIEHKQRVHFRDELFEGDDESFGEYLEEYYQQRIKNEHLNKTEYLRISASGDILKDDIVSNKKDDKHNRGRIHTLDDIKETDPLMELLMPSKPKKPTVNDPGFDTTSGGIRLSDGEFIKKTRNISKQIENVFTLNFEDILMDDNFESNIFMALCFILFGMILFVRIGGFVSGYKYASKQKTSRVAQQSPQIIVVPVQQPMHQQQNGDLNPLIPSKTQPFDYSNANFVFNETIL